MRIYDNQSLIYILEKSENIYVLISPLAGEESLVSGLSLKAILEPKKLVEVVFQGKFGEQTRSLPGGDRVRKNLPPKEVTISFDVSERPIEKVSYYLENRTFNLVIKPQSGYLDPKNIRFSTEALKIDLFIALGCRSLEDLGDVYKKNSFDFSKIPIVNIDYHQANKQFGQINIVDEGASGISEIIFANLGLWGLRPNYEAAECLLFGLGLLRDLQPSPDKGNISQSSAGVKVATSPEPIDNSFLEPPKIYTGASNVS